MSASRYRPKRRLRSELFPLAVILAFPIAFYFAFPRDTIGFVPSTGTVRSPVRSAFISLDGVRAAKLLAAARASWQSDSASRRGLRANLFDCNFPESEVRLASGLPPAVPERLAGFEEYEISAVPHSCAAPAPTVLPPLTDEPSAPAFPKFDLLKLK